ncbi:MAG: hypothetical protein GEV10_14240 [Streptosporangiales bacterium]|nr:hypothetical protein [Streptosporangiales bacterium]
MPRHRRLLAVALVAALACGVTAGCTPPGEENGTSPSPESTRSSEPTDRVAGGPRPPTKGAWIGAAVQPRKVTQEGRVQAFQEFESVTGRTLDVVHTYHPWDDPFPSAADEHFLERGQELLIGWAGSDSPGIAAGRYDQLIRQRARDVKAVDDQLMIAYRFEMDRPNLRSQVRSAKDYIAAWKHIRAIFAEEGATNVGWVWAPTAKGFTEGDAADFYPGDNQVDWLGVDAYTGPRLRPFSEVMRAYMDFAAEHPGKPIMIAEFGLSDRDGKRPAWLKAAREYVKEQPRIKAVLYFNGNSEARPNALLALQPSETGRTAFNDWLADPHFNTRRHPVTEPG